jgi:hypothetical protein
VQPLKLLLNLLEVQAGVQGSLYVLHRRLLLGAGGASLKERLAATGRGRTLRLAWNSREKTT